MAHKYTRTDTRHSWPEFIFFLHCPEPLLSLWQNDAALMMGRPLRQNESRNVSSEPSDYALDYLAAYLALKEFTFRALPWEI